MSKSIAVVTFGLEWRLNNAAVSGRCPLLLTDFSPNWGEWLFCTRTGLPVDMDAISESGLAIQNHCPEGVCKQLAGMESDPAQPWGKAGRIDYALSISAPMAPRVVLAQLYSAFTGPAIDLWKDEERVRLLALSDPLFDDMCSSESLWSSIVKGVADHTPALVAAAPALLPYLESFRVHLPALASALSREQLEDNWPRATSSVLKPRF